MPNAINDPVELIKRAAVDAVGAAKPVHVLFGTVATVAPLSIKMEQQWTLKERQLVLSRNVTDFTVKMTVEHTTKDHAHTHTIQDTYTGGGSASSETHRHAYQGTKEFLVHNALKVGEKVLLLRMQGGQKFVVVDRLGGKV